MSQYPEALHFSFEAKEVVTTNPQELITKIKSFLTSIDIPYQSVWQSQPQIDLVRSGKATKITFWVLPREADLDGLVTLINRVNLCHTLLGGTVSVQGPHSPQLQRCWECRLLGHPDTACPKFGGTAVRLRFKQPFGPYEFSQLVDKTNGIRAAMLGNTHAQEEWGPSHKATLFFNTPTTAAEMASFTQTLQAVSDLCRDRLIEPLHPVAMTQALRKSECVACGSRDSGHRCPSNSVVRPVAQQQPQVAGKASASSAAAAAAPPASKSMPVKESVETVAATMCKGMCGQWKSEKRCSNLGKCNRNHDPKWVPIPQDACRDLVMKGSCNYGRSCKFKHITFEELQGKQRGPAAAAAVAVDAGAAQPVHAPSKAASSKKPSGAGKRAAGAAASATSAAPATPRKETQRSSLESLASPASSPPARSQSTPAATPTTSGKKKLAFATKHGPSASVAAAAAAAPEAEEDGVPFQQVQANRHKRRRTDKQSEGTAAKNAAARNAIDVEDDDAMELLQQE